MSFHCTHRTLALISIRHLTNSFTSPPSKKYDKRRPLVDYPQGPPPKSSPNTGSLSSTSKTLDKPVLPSQSKALLTALAKDSGLQNPEERRTSEDREASSLTETRQYLPGGKWYRNAVANAGVNPRKGISVSQLLSDWERTWENICQEPDQSLPYNLTSCSK